MASAEEIQSIAQWVKKYPNSLCSGNCDEDIEHITHPRFIYYYLLLHPDIVKDYVDEHGSMITGSIDGTGCSHILSYNGLSCGRSISAPSWKM